MEEFFAHNPAVAVWIIGGMGGIIGTATLLMLSRVLKRMDSQDLMMGKMELEFVRAVAGIRARVHALEMHVWGRPGNTADHDE